MHETKLSGASAAGYVEQISRGDDGRPFRFPAAVIVAHPDDEFIGMGARLHRFTDMIFVHVTDGAPFDMRDARKSGYTKRENYARAREAEWAAAVAVAGVPTARHIDVGFVDQTASLRLPSLVRFVANLIARDGPNVVLTHPYEGGHPDHDATAMAVHAAIALESKRTSSVPRLVEFTSYHGRGGRLTAFEFIPRPESPPSVALLSDEERRRKAAMIACFATQRDVLKLFPIATEFFRGAPRYDFTRPPHEGKLYYENFDWGMDGARWTALATETLGACALECPL